MTGLTGVAVLSCRRHFVTRCFRASDLRKDVRPRTAGREMGEFSSISGLEDGTDEAMTGISRRSDKKYYVNF